MQTRGLPGKERRQPASGYLRLARRRYLQRLRLPSYEQDEAFLKEQFQANIWPTRVAMFVGAVIFLLRGFFDYANGLAVLNSNQDIEWRLWLFSILMVILGCYRARFSPRFGCGVIALFAVVLTLGICITVHLNPARAPYALMPLTLIFLITTALWPKVYLVVVTLLASSLPIAWLFITKTLAVVDQHAYLFYLITGLVLGLVMRRGRLNTAFDAYLLRQQLATQALNDPLTGVFNRAGWENHLLVTLRGGLPSYPASLLFFDLDHFKLVNDNYGHPVGDCLIQTVAQMIHSHLRSNDILARFGGEEFAVFLPDTPLGGAVVVAERIRQAIALNRDPVNTTVSIGVAEIRPGEILSSAMVRVDQALFKAKQTGRNQVFAAAVE